MARITFGLVALAALCAGSPARSETVRLLCSQGLKPVVEALIRPYEEATGDRLAVAYGTSVQLKARAEAGEPFDAIVLTPPLVADLIRQGKVADGSAVPLARAGAGVAVRAGAPHPDIATDEAFKRTLVEAKTVAYSTTGASGGVFAAALDKLGLIDAVRAKGRTVTDGLTGALVARGEADLAVQLMPELMSTPGVEVVGPFPPGFQSYVVLAAGLAAPPVGPGPGARLIAYLSAPAAQAVARAKGLEPLTRPEP